MLNQASPGRNGVKWRLLIYSACHLIFTYLDIQLYKKIHIFFDEWNSPKEDLEMKQLEIFGNHLELIY